MTSTSPSSMDLLASNDRSSGNFINSSDHGEQEKTNRQQSELEYSEDLLATRSQVEEEGAEEEEEELTVGEVVQRLQTAWINEKFAPALLPHQTQVVECLIDQTRQMEINLSSVSKTDFRVPLHRQELARVRYLLAAYLRLRLKKIQEFIHTLDLTNSDILSREEQAFARNYKDAVETHFKTLVLNHMPGDFSRMPDHKRLNPRFPEPNLDATVFIAVDREVRGLLLRDRTGQGRDEELDMAVGSQHVLKYRDVAPLVVDGSLRLI